MNNKVAISVYNPITMDLVNIFKDYRSLIINEKWQDLNTFELHVSKEKFPYILNNSILYFGNNEPYIVRSVSLNQDEYILKGYELLSILNHYAARYTYGDPEFCKIGDNLVNKIHYILTTRLSNDSEFVVDNMSDSYTIASASNVGQVGINIHKMIIETTDEIYLKMTTDFSTKKHHISLIKYRNNSSIIFGNKYKNIKSYSFNEDVENVYSQVQAGFFYKAYTGDQENSFITRVASSGYPTIEHGYIYYPSAGDKYICVDDLSLDSGSNVGYYDMTQEEVDEINSKLWAEVHNEFFKLVHTNNSYVNFQISDDFDSSLLKIGDLVRFYLEETNSYYVQKILGIDYSYEADGLTVNYTIGKSILTLNKAIEQKINNYIIEKNLR